MYWAEDDTMAPWFPWLESCTEPTNDLTYVMFHGTTKEAAECIMRNGFRPSKDGMLGPGVYVSRDPQKASRYPLNVPDHERRVMVLNVNVGKVKKIDYQGHPCQKTWHALGFDTAWVPPNCGMVSSGLEEDCVWDPRRIRVIEVIAPRSQPSDSFYSWNTRYNMGPWLESCSEPASDLTYVMFHGTTKEAAESIKRCGFRPSKDGMLGPGVYVSRDPEKARRYPVDAHYHERRVLVLSVNVGKVIKIDYQGHPCQKTWHALGFDTAWVPPNCGMVSSGLEEDCVWDPRRIKVTKVIKPVPKPL